MLIRILPFQNVAATGLATCNILGNLKGFTIDRLFLAMGGTTFTKAMMTGIQLKANSKIIFDDTGARVDSRMQYRGIAANASFLTLDFSELKSKTIIGQKIGCIDTTYGIESLTAEVQITGATAPTLTGWAEVSSPQGGDERPLIAKVLKAENPYSAAGTFAIAVPGGTTPGSLIKRVHFFGATVTGLMIKKNGIVIHESTASVNNFQLTEVGRVPQANVYTYDPVFDGNQSNMLNTVNASNMEWYVTVSGAGTVVAVSELCDPLANL